MWAIDGIHGNPGTLPLTTRKAQSPAAEQATPAEQAAPAPTPGPDELQTMAEELAQALNDLGQGHTVAFRQDEETGTPVVEIRDRDGEVLNQFPPEKILNLRRVLADLSGVVINRMT